MYYDHFGLKEPPFKITPNTEVFFTGGNRGAVLDAITYAILNGEGIVKVVGEVGSGKTMLCRMLQTLLPDHVESIYLGNPSVSPEDVLHAIAFELQIKLPKSADRLKVMQALQAYLLKRHAAGKQVVIFIEEAQGMPLATLEEIRLLSNLETNYDKLLQIVLFGQPELDENLNEINIRQLRERITHSFHLPPLHANEIGEYTLFRLRAAGYYGPPLFTNAAIKKLSSAAQGLVRRVNILADKALLAAFSENVYQVTPKHVKAAILDSEFGLEHAKVRRSSYKTVLMLAVLVLGLLLGYFASQWLQKDDAVRPVAAVVEKRQPPKKISETEALTESSTLPQNQISNTEFSVSEPSQNQTVNTESASYLPENEADGLTEQATGDDLLSRRIEATNTWLASEAPDTLSIQLMGVPEGAGLKNDLEQLGQKFESDKIYVYRTQVSGRPYLNVLYGSFENRAEAMAVLKQLPEEIIKNKPQLRTVSGVLQETKQLP